MGGDGQRRERNRERDNMFKQKASNQREKDPDLDFIIEQKDITIECGQ